MSGNGARDGRDETSGSAADGDLSGRLERLGAQLDAKRPSAEHGSSPGGQQSGQSSAIGLAFRLSAEFVAGVLAGGILGWLVDRLVGTAPWGLIVCLILGFAAGMLNLLRATGAVKPVRPNGR
ncbi:AtpZ/AtpI family protein [Enterovirga aerilata]|uniref:ATP synthase protein I n=1 Tax=Enterovirga aerilata TaxID=2730920 RepID=A0A849HZQ5_9HYPH|nr:AtpZ/AtpI family protein [Enterovirga sp. DB1703]NNM73006.1 ATP F0F1 synthase subunit I [Enterovirga sp. DB1703]